MKHSIERVNGDWEQATGERITHLETTIADLERIVADHRHTEVALRTQIAYWRQQAEDTLNPDAQVYEALRESEKRYRNLFEHASDAILICEIPSARILKTNEKATRLFLYSEEELRELTVFDLELPEDHTRCATVVEQIRAEESVLFEHRLVRKDGVVIAVEISARIIAYQGGQALQSFVRDITARTRTEQERDLLYHALDERGRFLDAVMQQMPTGVIIAEAPSGKMVLCNEKVAQILRHPFYQADSIDEYSQYEGYHADGRPYRPEEYPLARALVTGEVTEGEEMIYRRGDGTRCWLQVNAGPIRDQEGVVIGAVVTFFDVDKRKKDEEALKRYAERLETLHEIDQAILAARSPEAIAAAALHNIRELIPCIRASVVEFDLETDACRVLAVFSNDHTKVGAATRMSLAEFGLHLVDELRQGRVHKVKDTERLTQPSQVTQTLIAEQVRSYVNVPILSRGTLIGSLNLGACRPDGFSSEHFQIAREVAASMGVALQSARLFEQVHTGRERLQSLSRQLVKVQENERRYLAHELHDEIGQILTVVKMSLQTLQLSTDNVLPIHGLNEYITNVDHALERVRDLSLDLRPAILDDLGLVPALRWFVDRHAQRTGLTAQFIADPLEMRLPSELEVTCFRIAQEALTNTARHAQARQVRVELRQHDDAVALTVCDDGVGFDVEAALERATQGVSLGLLGMQERVTLIGGQIDLISRRRQGTEIRARFPLSPPTTFGDGEHRGKEL